MKGRSKEVRGSTQVLQETLQPWLESPLEFPRKIYTHLVAAVQGGIQLPLLDNTPLSIMTRRYLRNIIQNDIVIDRLLEYVAILNTWATICSTLLGSNTVAPTIPTINYITYNQYLVQPHEIVWVTFSFFISFLFNRRKRKRDKRRTECRFIH